MGKARRGGVSMAVKYGSGGGRFGLGNAQTTKYGVTKRIQERRAAEQRYIQNIAGLSHESQNALNKLAGDSDIPVEDSGTSFGAADVEMDDDDSGWTADVASGAGSGQSLEIDVADLVQFGRRCYTVWSKRIRGQRKDKRTWRNRLYALHMKWTVLIEPLADAFISWKYDETPPLMSRSKRPNDFADPQGWDFGIDVFDIYDLSRSALIPRDENTEAAIALVRAGFLGNVPEQPSFAISLRTLELLYTIRLYKASFSIEAFARVLCHTYSIPYQRFYRTAVSNAFDVYLDIRRCIDKRVSAVLGHDSPNYRMLNSCPACCYKLKDEPDLKFSRMWVCDGNNSLRRMAPLGGRRTGDTRVFHDSDYFLSTEYVDRFAHEVKSRPKTTQQQDDDDEGEDEDDILEEGGDPTDGSVDDSLAACTKNWKAASADAKKRMWNIFIETGIFASACRHGFILWLADMVQSGELAKYGLAMVSKALDTFDDSWIMGYDIGCSFSQTINSSSLGAKFHQQRCRTCVNAFHGYSHNFLCQLLFHPLNIEGMGLEDLETLERIFSLSNQLAPITRYATAYRRRILIDLFFQQWDEEKYQNLANMLHNNYLQALNTIETEGRDLTEGLTTLGLSTEDLERYFADEAQHFKDLGTETDEDLHAVAYVELLQQYRELRTSLLANSLRMHLVSSRAKHRRIIKPSYLQTPTI
ncbi:hypothetical protein VKT23_019891 [Stygiomarasmius scandens]|uniref:CxC1-like cysteine cluster associated with KDZ transposases domain-containing protein n=1 Tax=Marasmiellus scandens TaxID=2682957 RepID=A0ABR1IPI2_9AGAR